MTITELIEALSNVDVKFPDGKVYILPADAYVQKIEEVIWDSEAGNYFIKVSEA